MTDSAPDALKTNAAIEAALHKNWLTALSLNKELLASSSKDIPTLNRLGYAYFMLGKPILAKQMFTKVLKLDPYNRIATNNIKKLTLIKHNKGKDITESPYSPFLFLEEPGKTKIVDCVNVASSLVLSHLTPGQHVVLKCKKFSIDIRDMHGGYIGALPDDLSFRLLRFMKGGNTYSVCIKHVAKSCVSVFIREISRGTKFKHQISFANSVSSSIWGKQKLQAKENKGADDDTEEKEDLPEESE